MTPDHGPWRDLLERAAAHPRTAPRAIAECAVAGLGVSGAGVSVAGASGVRAIVCATDDRAQQVEDLQFTLGVGPCVDAVVDGVAVLVTDVDEPEDLDLERWPGFMEAAGAAGVRALFALPLRVGAIRVGALDLHRTEPGALSRTDLEAAFLAADYIACALVDLGIPEPAAPDLPWPGLSMGMQVHQATGMVQTQLGVDTASALLALRARAFSESTPLSSLARDVVERRVRFDQEDE